jgi:hypothetical protein
MVSAESCMIDMAFILAQAHKKFFSAPPLTVESSDYVFAFGFTKDFLRLRQNVGIRTGVLIIERKFIQLPLIRTSKAFVICSRNSKCHTSTTLKIPVCTWLRTIR